MSSSINPYSNIRQRNWQPLSPQLNHASRLLRSGDQNAPPKDPAPNAAFEIWREQQVLQSNSFVREFQTRKVMRQFLSKTHSLGGCGPQTMVVSHKFRVDVVATDARFVAGFTLARNHAVRLIEPDHLTWDAEVCSSGVHLSEGGALRSITEPPPNACLS
jgi:hypothetical protein